MPINQERVLKRQVVPESSQNHKKAHTGMGFSIKYLLVILVCWRYKFRRRITATFTEKVFFHLLFQKGTRFRLYR